MIFKQYEFMLLTVKIFITDQQKAELEPFHYSSRGNKSDIV